MPGAGVAAAVAGVRAGIAAAAERAGRDPAAVRLVAVTKGVPAEQVAQAVAAGVTDLGESRAQEMLAKVSALGAPAVSWHFVGRLQRNKIAGLAPVVSLWHSIESVEMGAAVARRAPGARVLAEVNVDGHPAKGGCRPAATAALVSDLRALGLSVRGLMTVPERGADPGPTFRALADLAQRLELAELSMGMSEDFETAVEEGATIVRVGRAIFGARPAGAGRPP